MILSIRHGQVRGGSSKLRTEPLASVCQSLRVADLVRHLETKLTTDYGSTVNATGLAPVPPGFVMAIGPVVAPGGTIAQMKLIEAIVNFAATPLNVTQDVHFASKGLLSDNSDDLLDRPVFRVSWEVGFGTATWIPDDFRDSDFQ
jgi:hypothetical protein